MDITTAEHRPGDLYRPLTPGQIGALCARAFGDDARPAAVHELGGGEYNTVYRIRLAGRRDDVVLRVAPPAEARVPWHEERLMRREHAIAPYFAPIAPLLPRTLAVDFTHQLIARDYLFQTCMPGLQWSRIEDQFSPDETAALWRQLAGVARTIHSVRGEAFGLPAPGRRFAAWSLTVLDWLERCIQDAVDAGLDASEIRAIRDIARAHAHLLDEIAEPRLMHGDLWTFNVLVARTATGPRITAVLDHDRASWGDPFAEWTFHLLPRRATPAVQAIFWDAYGRPAPTPAVRFRQQVYEGLHAGNALTDAARRNHRDVVDKARAILRGAGAALQAVASA
jgi:aminoglycoside phosphotransferase (APT) family kinase protein